MAIVIRFLIVSFKISLVVLQYMYMYVHCSYNRGLCRVGAYHASLTTRSDWPHCM